jgi:RNA polymerase sigma-70 factor (ECF subfamily)
MTIGSSQRQINWGFLRLVRQNRSLPTLLQANPNVDLHVDLFPTPSAWHDWLRSHARRFLLYARQRTRSEADAEDVLQDALVESWRRGGGVHPPDAALVFATIRRRAIDLARRTERRTQRELAGVGDDGWFAPGEADADEIELERAVKNLPEIYREVVTLKVWGELTFQQIGETIGIPLNTASSRYRYALEHLREALKEVRS